MPGVGLMVRAAGFGSEGPELKSRSAVELIPGGVNSTCHPSEVGKMCASTLVYCVGVATRPGLCPIAKETAEAAPTLCKEYGPNGWMDGWMDGWKPLVPLSDTSLQWWIPSIPCTEIALNLRVRSHLWAIRRIELSPMESPFSVKLNHQT